MTLLPTHLGGLVILELEKCGTSPANARSTADALIAAETDGQLGHGPSRVPSYAAQVIARVTEESNLRVCAVTARAVVEALDV